jgi:signal transduction histidine kinase
MTYNVFQRPYYYETNMFRIACLALSAALLSGVFLLRVRQITSQVKSRLEERLDERERIARDLHDTLLQSMQGLILRFQAITTQIPATEPSRRMMEECLDCADRVLIEGRDRVSTLRVPPEKSDLIQALARTGEEIERMAALNFSIVVTGSPRDLHPVVREEAYWIGREALLNAFHHSKGRTVEMEIAYANRMLTLQVRDDGQGIDPKTLESAPGTKHWGVVGMRERAGKIGSHLAIHSRMGGGTEVELVIPASIAYRRRLRASRSNWFRQFRFGGYS